MPGLLHMLVTAGCCVWSVEALCVWSVDALLPKSRVWSGYGGQGTAFHIEDDAKEGTLLRNVRT